MHGFRLCDEGQTTIIIHSTTMTTTCGRVELVNINAIVVVQVWVQIVVYSKNLASDCDDGFKVELVFKYIKAASSIESPSYTHPSELHWVIMGSKRVNGALSNWKANFSSHCR